MSRHQFVELNERELTHTTGGNILSSLLGGGNQSEASSGGGSGLSKIMNNPLVKMIMGAMMK